MENNQRPALGERIRQIREAKGMSIETLAKEINSNKSTVSRLERGETVISAENMAKIRKILGIEDAPLLDNEIELYNRRVWVWHEMLYTDRILDAKAMQGEMQAIMHLPYEHNLIGMYLVQEARLLARDRDISGMTERLAQAEQYLNNASNELLFLYHSTLANANLTKSAGYSKKFLKEALKHTLIALEHETDNLKADSRFCLYLGSIYTRLGDPIKGIFYLERALQQAQQALSPGNINFMRVNIGVELSQLYVYMGKLKAAKNLINTTITIAKSLNVVHQISALQVFLASIAFKENKYDEALEYSLQAEKHIPSSITLIHLLTERVAILQKLKKTTESKALMEQIRERAQGQDLLILRLDTMEHLLNLNNGDSAKYLETKVIPKLITEGNGYDMLKALDICKELEAHYLKKKAKTKAMAIAVVARDIYEELFYGDKEL